MKNVENQNQSSGASASANEVAPPTVETHSDPLDTPAADSHLPYELTPETPGGGESSEHTPAEILARLQRFYLYGERPAREVAPTDDESALPAALHPYRDLSRHRYEYPLCVNGKGPGAVLRSLAEVIDELIAGTVEEGDEGERMKRHMYRVESAIKTRIEKGAGDVLSTMWVEAAADVVSASKLSHEKKEILSRDLNRAGQTLTAEADLMACTDHTPMRLFMLAARSDWQSRCAGWRDELATLIERLQDILVVDDEHAPEATSPDHLRDTVGPRTGDDIDPRAMSEILGASELGTPLAGERRRRIEAALSTLRAIAPVYGVGDGKPPFDVHAVVKSGEVAVREHETRMVRFADFYKAVRIARLEIANGYRESVHDTFFAEFDRRHLTGDELSLCPPILLALESEPLAGREAAVLDLLRTDMPIKILLVIDALFEDVDDGRTIRASWKPLLAGAAIAANRVFVLQSPVSRPSLIQEWMGRGMGFDGPSLFAVYARSGDTVTDSTYLDAAAAAESRCFPVVVFDPSQGERLADRIRVSDNPQSEGDWPQESFAYRAAGGDAVAMDLAFTPAEFLFCDRRFASYFWMAPPRLWHESMVPFNEFIEMDLESHPGRIPYVTTVDEKGRVGRAVTRLPIVEAVLGQRAYWRQLQETGGIHNSFVIDAITEKKQRLAEEKRLEVEEIEKNYIAQIDQDIGELTREIVQRIANRLIEDDAHVSDLPARPVERAAPAIVDPVREPAEKPEQPTAPAADEADDDEVAALDDPYIDTPLCTSCNECTQLNSQLFAYNGNKQAFIKDASAGPYKDLVRAAELCPVHIIHPGKPADPNEPDLPQWVERAAPFV